jgi:TonB-linked SusC/RagA family outer membrane protein
MRLKFKWIFTLLLALSMQFSFAQEKTVTGVVSDATGPIPGANVVVKGTNRSAQTDFDGKYSIKASTGEILVFSFVGMQEVTATVGASSIVNAKMEQVGKTLEEVVVVGYGTQKKRGVTGSITSIKGSSIANLATPSFESQLAGRATGVQITSQSGILGEVPRIRIRGINSISNGTYPLVVVDGIPIFTGDTGGQGPSNALGDINPADIESYEILKDGSATAIYGSRASAGVILITTKKGKGGLSKLSYNAYVGVAQPIATYDLLKTNDFITISNEKRSNNGATPWARGTAYDTDWQKAVLRSNAVQVDHNLSLSGSTEKTNYYFSLGYNTQEGISLPNDQERITARVNLEQKIKSWLKIGTSIGLTQTENSGMNRGVSSLSGNIYNATKQLPNTPIYDASTPSGYNVVGNSVGQAENFSGIANNLTNIVYVLNANKATSKAKHILGNFYTDIAFLPELHLKTQLSIDDISNVGFYSANPFHGDGSSVGGSLTNDYTNSSRWNIQNVLSYEKTFGNDHNLGAVLISEYQKQRTHYFFSSGQGLSDPFFGTDGTISDSYTTQFSGGGISENGIISYAGRLNYNYKEKYFVQASIRKDGLSKLPSANRWGTFPGASVGWTISKENFMQSIHNVVSDLKIRASYAEVGNTEIGNYSYLSLYNGQKYAANNGIGFSQQGNDQLQWETSKKYDYGIDANLFNGKLKLTVDYFENNLDNQILGVPQALSLGIPGNSINKNIGTMKNSGFEFSLDAPILKNNDFDWNVSVNLSLLENKVQSLVNHQDILSTDNNNILREGESFNALFGYNYWGVNPANGNPVYYKQDGTLVQGNITSGSYRVFDPANPSDISVAGVALNNNDKKILGGILPTYFGAFNSSMSYKNIDFGFMFRFSGGNKIMNTTRRELLSQNFVNNGTEILGRWQSVANPGDGQTPKLSDTSETFINLAHASTRFVEKGDYIKLDNVSLGYSLPKFLLDKLSVDKFRLYVQGQNLLIITKYKGLDPEMERGGVDYNGNPRLSVFTMGLNVSF